MFSLALQSTVCRVLGTLFYALYRIVDGFRGRQPAGLEDYLKERNKHTKQLHGYKDKVKMFYIDKDKTAYLA